MGHEKERAICSVEPSFTMFNQKVLTVALLRYVGDVLCLSFLEPNCGLVEGGPSLFRWICHLSLELNRKVILPASTWYRTWVLLHSSLLRLLPSSIQIALFGTTIPPFSSSAILRRLKLIAATVRDYYEACAPRFAFFEFGSLGPTFRGRDRVQSFGVVPGTICSIIIELINSDDINEEVLMRSLDWLVTIHRESGKVRPMTVRSPVVTFSTNL